MFRRKRLYSNEDLLIRASLGLWTHVLEDFTCAKLATIWGCSQDQAWRVKREPYGIYGDKQPKELQGTRFLSEDMKRKLREYLEVSDESLPV